MPKKKEIPDTKVKETVTKEDIYASINDRIKILDDHLAQSRRALEIQNALKIEVLWANLEELLSIIKESPRLSSNKRLLEALEFGPGVTTSYTMR